MNSETMQTILNIIVLTIIIIGGLYALLHSKIKPTDATREQSMENGDGIGGWTAFCMSLKTALD